MKQGSVPSGSALHVGGTQPVVTMTDQIYQKQEPQMLPIHGAFFHVPVLGSFFVSLRPSALRPNVLLILINIDLEILIILDLEILILKS